MAMENNQSTQQSTEASDSKLASSSRPGVGLPDKINFLLQFLKRAPWLIWAALWLLLVATSVVAIFNLTHTGFVAQRNLQPTPANTLPLVKTPAKTTQPTPLQKPVKVPSRTGTSLALLLIGAAVICTVGYLVVFKILFTPSSGKTRQRVRASQRRHNRQQRRRLLQANNPPIIVTPVPEENALEPEPEPKNINLNNAYTEPVVTILPPETSEPLNVEVSLAEMMDIRKHRSLSSILEENVEQESQEEK